MLRGARFSTNSWRLLFRLRRSPRPDGTKRRDPPVCRYFFPNSSEMRQVAKKTTAEHRGGRDRRRATNAALARACAAGARPLQLAGLSDVVTGQVAQQPPVGGAADHANQCLDARVFLQGFRKDQVVVFLAHGKKIESRLLARQPNANARVGPAVAQRLGDGAMVTS